ncbi:MULTISPECIES: hypothetical protein [unclassified Synechocystis]|uniref:hypothetical protein n=1 Tax=unclassified Synechocystis TaxID=2640012 RepID=UPI001CBEA68A|nr:MULTISPECIES: hypothetical protein [unclassified Synechocystis]
MKTLITEEVVEQLRSMPQYLQLQVVEFIQRLNKTQIQGKPGQKLLHFAGFIPD